MQQQAQNKARKMDLDVLVWGGVGWEAVEETGSRGGRGGWRFLPAPVKAGIHRCLGGLRSWLLEAPKREFSRRAASQLGR
jgi:hypothetical protein